VRRIDTAGLVTLTTGLTALILVLMEGKFWGWGSSETLALLALATIGLVSFVVFEASSRTPMLDLVSFRSRTFLGANAIAFLVSFAMLSVFFFLPLYMQNILGYSPLQAGVRFLPCALMVALVAPLAGRLADRVPPRVLITAGMLLVTTALLWLAQISVATSYDWLLVGFVVIGAGIALVMSPMSTAAMNAVDAQKAGAASGMLSMSRMIGGTFGVAALGALVATLGRERLDVLLPALTPERREQLAAVLGGHSTTVGGQVAGAARDAFVAALATSLAIAAALAALGAIIAFAFIKRAPVRTSPGLARDAGGGTAPQTDPAQAGQRI
jgi:MFS family permease